MSQQVKVSEEWVVDLRRMAEHEHDPCNYIGVEVIIDWVRDNQSRIISDLATFGKTVTKDGIHISLLDFESLL